ncbi:MAG: TrkA family potassium uptake protein [Chloroflexi bacterium]|nr:TrkA family potassium uptake protein [Chloroflexota bacterium]
MTHQPSRKTRSRRRKFSRFWRAFWQDTSALWREFRRPVLTFLIATLIGGFIYGELRVIAGQERMAYADLPYAMIQLMTLQGIPEEQAPEELYLVAFWYLMPMIGLYLIGRGAVDFVRVFFNRSERRRAWEEALASTYRQHIIVLGIGNVGLRVIHTLDDMGFEVVAIDNRSLSPTRMQDLRGRGVPLIIGEGSSQVTLEKAQIAEADALVVCTSNDLINLTVTIRARDINPHVRIVVRMWDHRLRAQLKDYLGVEVLSASELAAPAFAGAGFGVDIAQTLEVGATQYSVFRLTIRAGSLFAGQTIRALQNDNDMDIVLHERAGRVQVHPEHDLQVCPDDELVIFARHQQIRDLVMQNRHAIHQYRNGDQQQRHVVVVGVGNVGLRVTRALCAIGLPVVAVDQRLGGERRDELKDLNVRVITADGSHATTLEQADLANAQAIIVCTSDDLVNLTVAVLARDINPNLRIVVRMWDDRIANQLKRHLGVAAVLSASELAAPAFAGAAFGVSIAQTLEIEGTRYSVFRMTVEPGSQLEGDRVEHLEHIHQMDIVLCERNGIVDVHPDHDNIVRAGDTLILFAQHVQLTQLVANNRRREILRP